MRRIGDSVVALLLRVSGFGLPMKTATVRGIRDAAVVLPCLAEGTGFARAGRLLEIPAQTRPSWSCPPATTGSCTSSGVLRVPLPTSPGRTAPNVHLCIPLWHGREAHGNDNCRR